MVSEFVCSDQSRNDAFALHSYTRGSFWWHDKNNWASPRKVSGVMKWKSTVENSGLLGVTVFDLKELPRRHHTKRICGMTYALDARYWTNTHMVTSSLSFRKACVFVCVCVFAYVCVWVCVYIRMCSVRPVGVFCTYGWSEMKVRREFE